MTVYVYVYSHTVCVCVSVCVIGVWVSMSDYCLCAAHRQKDRDLAQVGPPVIQPQRVDGPRFAGGGFSLKTTNRVTT